MTDDPNSPDGIDTRNKAVPPYKGRQKAADTERGATGSPSDEQPASDVPETKTSTTT